LLTCRQKKISKEKAKLKGIKAIGKGAIGFGGGTWCGVTSG